MRSGASEGESGGGSGDGGDDDAGLQEENLKFLVDGEGAVLGFGWWD